MPNAIISTGDVLNIIMFKIILNYALHTDHHRCGSTISIEGVHLEGLLYMQCYV